MTEKPNNLTIQNPAEEEAQQKDKHLKKYTYQDLLEFESKYLHTSVGRMIDSRKQTEPTTVFGTASRDKAQMVFQSKELSKSQFLGRTSSGPKYEVRGTDKYYYKEDPKWSFSKHARNTLETGAKYAYYFRDDDEFDPLESDLKRRKGQKSVRIGLESRFNDSKNALNDTPGPEYDPGPRLDWPSQPVYTLGYRRIRAGESPIAPNTSTPRIVGPGRYLQGEIPNLSTHQDFPKISFTKSPKFMALHHDPQKNQTFDVRSSIGEQISSKKKTLPAVGFTKESRDYQRGMFRDHLSTQPTRIRMVHAKY